MSENISEIRNVINGLEALSQFLGLGRAYVFELQREGKLPPAILLPGRKTPLFLVGDVMEWLEAHRTILPATHRAKGRGRPTKREQKAAREAAEAVA